MNTTAVSCVGPRRHEAKQGEGKSIVTLGDLEATEGAIYALARYALGLFRRISVNAPTDEEVFGTPCLDPRISDMSDGHGAINTAAPDGTGREV